MDYVLALIPALAWGMIGIITKKMGGKTEEQTFGTMLGFLFFALFVYIFKRPDITRPMIFIGVLSGILLALGNFGQFDAMTELGVSRAVPLVASGQLIVKILCLEPSFSRSGQI